MKMNFPTQTHNTQDDAQVLETHLESHSEDSENSRFKLHSKPHSKIDRSEIHPFTLFDRFNEIIWSVKIYEPCYNKRGLPVKFLPYIHEDPKKKRLANLVLYRGIVLFGYDIKADRRKVSPICNKLTHFWLSVPYDILCNEFYHWKEQFNNLKNFDIHDDDDSSAVLLSKLCSDSFPNNYNDLKCDAFNNMIIDLKITGTSFSSDYARNNRFRGFPYHYGYYTTVDNIQTHSAQHNVQHNVIADSSIDNSFIDNSSDNTQVSSDSNSDSNPMIEETSQKKVLQPVVLVASNL